MLIPVFGDPSEAALSGLRAIQTLAEVALGPYHWISVGTAHDLLAAWKERQGELALFFADCPDNRISSLFLENRVPVVIFLNAPISIARTLQRTRKIEFISAIRAASQSLATLHDLVVSPTSLVITKPLSIRTLPYDLRKFADFYGMRVSDAALRETVRRLAPFIERSGLASSNNEELPQAESVSNVMLDCLHCFDSLLSQRRVYLMRWPKEVFLDADKNGALIQHRLDLTGPARLFMFGPFLHLPKGRWIATATFEVSENISGNILKMDVYSDGIIAAGKCKMPVEGHFVSELVFEVLEPRLPLELRFHTAEGAIEGYFELKQVDIRRA